MTPHEDAVEEIAALTRSLDRARILALIQRQAPVSRDEIRSELSCSRTTVTRNITELVERGWVRETDQTYVLAPGADTVIRSVLSLAEEIQRFDDLRPVFEHVSSSSVPADLLVDSEVEVVTGDSDNPYRMVNEHVRAIRESADICLALPLLGLHAYEALRDRVVDAGADVEIVVTEGCAETMLSDPAFEAVTADLLQAESFRGHVTSQEVPLFVGLLDRTAQLGVDDDGEPQAILTTADERVRQWAREEISTWREGSVPLEQF